MAVLYYHCSLLTLHFQLPSPLAQSQPLLQYESRPNPNPPLFIIPDRPTQLITGTETVLSSCHYPTCLWVYQCSWVTSSIFPFALGFGNLQCSFLLYCFCWAHTYDLSSGMTGKVNNRPLSTAFVFCSWGFLSRDESILMLWPDLLQADTIGASVQLVKTHSGRFSYSTARWITRCGDAAIILICGSRRERP